jgi:hypothetical protein
MFCLSVRNPNKELFSVFIKAYKILKERILEEKYFKVSSKKGCYWGIQLANPLQ